MTQRPERTAQGYKRFRCRGLWHTVNERSGTVLNRTQHLSDVIVLKDSYEAIVDACCDT